MDSTEFNKIAGAALGALLVFLLLGFFSRQIYGTGESEHGEEQVLAFALEVEPAAGAGEEAEKPQVDLAALFSHPDVDAGAKVFRACSACHAVEAGVNKVGPSLHGVVGRQVASIEGFGYSDAMAAHGGEWAPEEMFHFLENPKAWVPGTKMSFAGLGDPQDRADVIAYLNQQGDAPIDLTAGLEPAATVADAGQMKPEAAGEPATGEAEQATAGGAPAAGEPAGSEGGSEASAAQKPASPVEVGKSTVDEGAEGAEGAEAPELPAAESTTEGGQQAEAQGQAKPDAAVEPGEGSKPGSGQPEAGTPEQAAEAPSPTPPTERVAGADAPPQQPPGQAEAAQGGSQGGAEGTAAPAEQEQQVAAAPAASGAAAAASETGGTDFSGGDAAAGEKLFRRCGACHKVEEGKNAIGPSLWGVVDRPVASVDGYSYSDAMKAHGGEWTPARLFEYLENPRGIVPGTKMAFAGLKKPEDRINVITYLNQADGSPEPLQ